MANHLAILTTSVRNVYAIPTPLEPLSALPGLDQNQILALLFIAHVKNVLFLIN